MFKDINLAWRVEVLDTDWEIKNPYLKNGKGETTDLKLISIPFLFTTSQ